MRIARVYVMWQNLLTRTASGAARLEAIRDGFANQQAASRGLAMYAFP